LNFDSIVPVIPRTSKRCGRFPVVSRFIALRKLRSGSISCEG
jgi:hypothetical protein